MAEGRFVSYLRVSTAKQGHSGLGLEAHRQAMADYLNGGSWQLVTEVVEIESGKRSDRPKLTEALRLCPAAQRHPRHRQAGSPEPRCALPARAGEGRSGVRGG
jgi:hypothetical protein